MRVQRGVGLGIAGLAMIVALGFSPAAAELRFVDSPWKQIRKDLWHKEIGGIGGQADLVYEIIREGKKTTKVYTVILPCSNHEKHERFFWKDDEAVARGMGCDDSPLTTETGQWIEVFRPLPYDPTPSTRPAELFRKEEKQQIVI